MDAANEFLALLEDDATEEDPENDVLSVVEETVEKVKLQGLVLTEKVASKVRFDSMGPTLLNKLASRRLAKNDKLDYQKVVSKRYELQATYSGILPGQNKRGFFKDSKKTADDQSPFSSRLTLLGPTLAKSSIQALNKTLAEEKKVEDDKAKIDADSGTIKKPLTKEELKKRKQMKSAYYLRHRLEGEMIKQAVALPITVAARNFAAAHNVKVETTNNGKQLATKGTLKAHDFKNASEVFNVLKPKAPTEKIPKLGSGMMKGDVIDLMTGKTQSMKNLRAAALVRQKATVSTTVTAHVPKKRSLQNIMQKVDKIIIEESGDASSSKPEEIGQLAKKRCLEIIETTMEKSDIAHEVEHVLSTDL